MKKKTNIFISITFLIFIITLASFGVFALTSQPSRDIEFKDGWAFLHGNAVIFDKGNDDNLTKVYRDNNKDGKIDTTDDLLEFDNLSGSKEGGYDLSDYIVYAVGTGDYPHYDSHTGDVEITMIGGFIKELSGSMNCENIGDFRLHMTGGTILNKICPAGSGHWKGNITVQIGGNSEIGQAVYGAGENANVTVDGHVKITVRDNAIIGNGSEFPKGVYASGQQSNNVINGTSTIDIQGGTVYGEVAGNLYQSIFKKDLTLNISGGQLQNVIGVSKDTEVPSVTINMTGGTLKGTTTLRTDDHPVENSIYSLNMEGKPHFIENGNILLRKNEFLNVGKIEGDDKSIIINTELIDNAGTLIAKPKDSTIELSKEHFELLNSSYKLLFGQIGESKKNLYLGKEATLGDFVTDTEVKPDAPSIETDLDKNKEDFLNEEDNSNLLAGIDISLKLFVDNANETVEEEVKEEFISYDKKWNVGQYLDVYMKKYIGTTEIDLKTINKEIQIVMDIPENLKKEKRQFSILRSHQLEDGSTEMTQLEDLDDNDSTITFHTQRFSIYAIMYQDAPHVHKFDTEWKTDSKGHWHECMCGEKSDFEKHTPDNGVIVKEATETMTGIKRFACLVCKRSLYEDIIPVVTPNHPENPTQPEKPDVPNKEPSKETDTSDGSPIMEYTILIVISTMTISMWYVSKKRRKDGTK